MRVIDHRHVLQPSVDYLEKCGVLLLDARQLSEFLRVPHKTVRQMVYTDRIPLPTKLGLSNAVRWNIMELLEWVEAGCPRRTQ